MSNSRRFSSFSVSIALIVIGVLLIVGFSSNAIASFKAPVDIEMITAEQVKDGVRVEGRLDFILDAFASLETSTKTSKAKTSQLYYIYELMDTGHIIAIEGKAADEDVYNKIMDETYSYIMGESETYGETGIQYAGVIRPIKGDLKKYYDEWITDSGYWDGLTEEETADLQLPFIVEEVDFTMSVIFSIGGIALVIIGGVILLIKGLKNKKAKEDATMNYAYPQAQEPQAASTTETVNKTESPDIK